MQVYGEVRWQTDKKSKPFVLQRLWIENDDRKWHDLMTSRVPSWITNLACDIKSAQCWKAWLTDKLLSFCCFLWFFKRFSVFKQKESNALNFEVFGCIWFKQLWAMAVKVRNRLFFEVISRDAAGMMEKVDISSFIFWWKAFGSVLGPYRPCLKKIYEEKQCYKNSRFFTPEIWTTALF